MKKRTKKRVGKVGLLGLAIFLLVSSTLAMLAGRTHYQNYWSGIVFAPFAIIVAILLLVLLYKDGRSKAREIETDEQLFEGPLRDWRKW